jgi:hypothetical protein
MTKLIDRGFTGLRISDFDMFYSAAYDDFSRKPIKAEAEIRRYDDSKLIAQTESISGTRPDQIDTPQMLLRAARYRAARDFIEGRRAA